MQVVMLRAPNLVRVEVAVPDPGGDSSSISGSIRVTKAQRFGRSIVAGFSKVADKAYPVAVALIAWPASVSPPESAEALIQQASERGVKMTRSIVADWEEQSQLVEIKDVGSPGESEYLVYAVGFFD